VIKKDSEKILKQKDLTTEIQHMWNVNAVVILGATGTVSKSLRQYLSNIPGKYEIKELQKKNSHIGHCTLLRKVLVWKYKTYFTGEITLHVARIVNVEQLRYY